MFIQFMVIIFLKKIIIIWPISTIYVWNRNRKHKVILKFLINLTNDPQKIIMIIITIDNIAMQVEHNLYYFDFLFIYLNTKKQSWIYSSNIKYSIGFFCILSINWVLWRKQGFFWFINNSLRFTLIEINRISHIYDLSSITVLCLIFRSTKTKAYNKYWLKET